MLSRVLFAACVLGFAAAELRAADPPAGAPKELIVHPKKVELRGPRAEQRVIVLGVWADGRKWDLTRAATFTSANAKVATAEKGTLRPVADGNTTLTVEAAGATASVPVVVERATADVPVSFAREVQPILTKAGCNSGGCHGAQHGRGGFKLSLFGFDAGFDYVQIVQSNEGRRVVPSDPERSILLAKPALVMEHGGGEKLKHNGRDYVTVRQWLEDGAPRRPRRPTRP